MPHFPLVGICRLVYNMHNPIPVRVSIYLWDKNHIAHVCFLRLHTIICQFLLSMSVRNFPHPVIHSFSIASQSVAINITTNFIIVSNTNGIVNLTERISRWRFLNCPFVNKVKYLVFLAYEAQKNLDKTFKIKFLL